MLCFALMVTSDMRRVRPAGEGVDATLLVVDGGDVDNDVDDDDVVVVDAVVVVAFPEDGRGEREK